MNLNLLKSFIKVAEFGSFTKAARHLHQPKSRVSRSVARLEEELNLELIKRTTRAISLTEAGKSLYQGTQGPLFQLERKMESLSSEGESISGTLSLSAPLDFGDSLLPQLICEFSKQYPDIKFKVFLSDSYVDLVSNDIDLALRVGNLKDSSLKQKRLTDAKLILVASPAYLSLRGSPKKWSELSGHEVHSFFNENQNDPLGEIFQKYKFSPAMRINSFPMLKQLACHSKGIVILPNTICKKELNEGTLVRVMPHWSHQKSPLQIVYSASRGLPLKTRTFIDFLFSNKEMFE